MKKRTKGRWITPFLMVFLLMEGFICISVVIGTKESFQYGMDYECPPLKMKQIVVINRTDLEDAFQMYDGEQLYEIRVTYENYGDFAAEYFGRMDFVSEETGSYCPEARRLVTDNNLQYLMKYNQMIPAGETAAFKRFLSVEEGTRNVSVTDWGEKLNGEKEISAVLALPENPGERTEVILE